MLKVIPVFHHSRMCPKMKATFMMKTVIYSIYSVLNRKIKRLVEGREKLAKKSTILRKEYSHRIILLIN
jgi:hypothetical protein